MHGRKISDNVLITPRVFTEESFFSNRNESSDEIIEKTGISTCHEMTQIGQESSKIVTLLGFISGSTVGNINSMDIEEDSGRGSNSVFIKCQS